MAEEAILGALSTRLPNLGIGVAPANSPAHTVLGGNDAAAALLSHLGESTRALLSAIAGRPVAIHFDTRAVFLSTAPLGDLVARARPDIVALAGLEADEPTSLAVIEMKDLLALPNWVIGIATRLRNEGWEASLDHEEQLQAIAAPRRGPYQIRPSTTQSHRLTSAEMCLAANIVDLAAYAIHLSLRWAVLTNGNRHVLVHIDRTNATISNSRPFGRGIAASALQQVVRPRSLLWLLGATALARVTELEEEDEEATL